MLKKTVYNFSILFVAMILVISTQVKDASASLKDVPAKYSSEIQYLLNKKVIQGYPDKTFGPKRPVTREEAVTMVGRALGYNGKQRNTSFKDVSSTAWSSGYIQTAFEKKILTQSAEGTFRPKDTITRGEMAYLMKRAFNLTQTSSIVVKDPTPVASLNDAINAVITAGLSNGYEDGSFQHKNLMTREEFSLFLARALNPQYRVNYETEPISTATVKATSLNVRSGPSTSHSIVGGLPNKSSVIVYRYEGDWAYIVSGTIKGYVHRDYLIVSETPSVPTKPSVPTVPSIEKIVALDAGHGGKDPGAVANGLQEKEINLAVAKKVEQILKQKGIKVVMTRSDDTFLELSERVTKAVQQNADTFVSIHANNFSSSSANGTETYYSTASLNSRAENSKELATFIQNRLYKALGTSDRGVKQGSFHVIKHNPLPSVLVELGFISNHSDAQKLASEEYRNKAANAIALGIIDYYNWRK